MCALKLAIVLRRHDVVATALRLGTSLCMTAIFVFRMFVDFRSSQYVI